MRFALLRRILSLLATIGVGSTLAVTYTVRSAADFTSIPATLQGGDEVVVQDGTYAAVQRTYTANASAANPVIFRAEHPGQVYFSGSTRFMFNGSGLVFSGFRFDGDVAPGGPSGSAIIRLNLNSSDIVLRDCVFNNFDDGVPTGGAFWLLLNGYRHTIEYCSFTRKNSQDPLINIFPQEDESAPAGTAPTKDVPRHHRIRYCYFGERTNIGENEFETIRVGGSGYQMHRLATVVEYCVFEKAIYGADITATEPEIISSKSRGNIYRYNTFIHCKGGIVLRAGDDCLVEGNFFFAEPGSNMGAGIRVIGQRHIVRNNYLQDIAGTGLRSPIVIMKGDSEFTDDSTSSGYELPSFARIFHNTIVNCTEPLQLGGTTSTSGSNIPRGVEFRGNVIVSSTGAGPVLNLNGAPIAAFTFEGNYAYHPDGRYGDILPATGLTTDVPLLHTYDPGLGYAVPSVGSPVIGQAPSTVPATRRDLRGLLRSSLSRDAGAIDTQATGLVLNRPLSRQDVGPAYTGRLNPGRAPLLLVPPSAQTVLETHPVTFQVVATSDEPLTYQWYRDEQPIPDATADTYSLASTQLSDSSSFIVSITNSAGTLFTVPVALTVLPVHPSITQQPLSQFQPVGSAVELSVVASGESPFSYTWLKDGVVIAGADGPTLAFSTVQPADAGHYQVVVANRHGSATSEIAFLDVPAANQAVVVFDSFSDGNRSADTPPESLAWWSSSSTSTLSVNQGTLTQTATGGRHLVAHFPARTLNIGESLEFRFSFSLGSTPVEMIGGLRFGLFHRDSRAAFTADAQNSATILYPGYGIFTNLQPTTGTPTILRRRDSVTNGALLTAMTSYSTTSAIVSGGPLEVFSTGTTYRAAVFIERLSENSNRVTAVYHGNGLSSFVTSGIDSLSPTLSFDTLAIGIGSSNSVPALTALSLDDVIVLHTVGGTSVPPTITAQPLATSGTLGHGAQLAVSASGAAPLTYQWFRDTTPLPDQTAATLTFSQLQSTDAGTYHVVVTNSHGAARSSSVTLTVTTPPPSAFAQWNASHFSLSELSDSTVSGPAADPDHDGLANLLEYALATDPRHATDSGPQLATVEDSGATYLTLTFNRIADPALTYLVQTSATLAADSWQNLWSSTGTANQAGTVTVRDNTPLATSAARFLRLKVEHSPVD